MAERMIIDLDNLSEAERVHYRGAVYLGIRPTSHDKYKEIEEEALKLAKKKGLPRKVAELQEHLLRNWLIEHWEGIDGPDDEPLPCTRKIKIKVLGAFHEMRNFVVMQSEAIAERRALVEEEDSGNSDETSSESEVKTSNSVTTPSAPSVPRSSEKSTSPGPVNAASETP